MANTITPEDLQKIIAEIIANKSKEETELDEGELERLYIENFPEYYDYYYPEEEKKEESPIVIKI